MEPIPQEEEEAAAIEAEGGNSESDSSDSEEKEKDGETGRSPERQARRKQRQGDGSPVEERRESGETDRSGSGGGVQHREDSRDSFEDEALTDDEPVEAEGGVGGRENTGEEKGGRGRQRGKKKGETSPNGGGGVGAPVVPYPSPSSDDGKERKKHPRTELPVTRLAHAVSPLSRSGSHERAGGGWTPGGSSVQASPAVQQARGLWQYRQQVVVAVGCAFCQNLTAANSVLYYSTDIFRLAGLNCPFTAGVGVGVMKVVGVIASAWLVEGDTWGRRKLLLVGTFGAFVCHLMFVAAFSMLPEHPKSFERLLSEAAGGAGLSQPRGVILVLVTMYLYMFFWNFSWAGLMFVVASEVLPSGVRGQGMGLVVITYWLVSFIMQLTLESSFEVFTKSGTFALYAFLTLLALLFTYTYIPETKGKSLEEITKFFEKRRKRRLLSLFGKRSSQANTHRRGSPHGLSGHFSSSGGNGEARTVTIEMTPAGPPGSSDDGDIRVHGYGHSTTPVKRPPRDPLADPEQSVSPSRPHAQHMYGYTATAARSGESLEREESGSQVYRPAAAGGAGAGVGSRGRSRTSVEGMEMEAGDRENSTQFDDIDLNGSPRSSFPAAPGSANPNSGQHKFMY
uniref:Major facilitator superfamily (MFS) profile domain-containing protein n=1 Tax=Chromera velia CCMP2878 TaxID=1169474 RepID=A0A0G4FFA5_9ALVE|eukprot:Cvel_16689.t1-p1 / transcript=Cvel_16689.t1 / gene=Cvel_16689 / organism=Chromera_velia_CCMP2878 / gene_product=Probable glucose transporter rco-3, putative / transcript_product=Probable glucose transporter rco-3, putative / location=Cvel_scaffold1296:6627-11166(+) / protein_length=622 / sequence_SO=supercontig / SO=protein_coding / is_pseudo=false